jgi:hypothetical protein
MKAMFSFSRTQKNALALTLALIQKVAYSNYNLESNPCDLKPPTARFLPVVFDGSHYGSI